MVTTIPPQEKTGPSRRKTAASDGTPEAAQDSPDSTSPPPTKKKGIKKNLRTMAWISSPVLAVLVGLQFQWALTSAPLGAQAQDLPAQAQVVDQRSFNGM